jgi:hypothetical protein
MYLMLGAYFRQLLIHCVDDSVAESLYNVQVQYTVQIVQLHCPLSLSHLLTRYLQNFRSIKSLQNSTDTAKNIPVKVDKKNFYK